MHLLDIKDHSSFFCIFMNSVHVFSFDVQTGATVLDLIMPTKVTVAIFSQLCDSLAIFMKFH